jgi:hypothetical protein
VRVHGGYYHCPDNHGYAIQEETAKGDESCENVQDYILGIENIGR